MNMTRTELIKRVDAYAAAKVAGDETLIALAVSHVKAAMETLPESWDVPEAAPAQLPAEGPKLAVVPPVEHRNKNRPKAG